ncbi:ABC transporter permease [Solirubrobacter ginsenosidimutans]|uniref:ABC transporter permease n=1 Tax=Solirubrobacter ginsenosidimutans TaxID=490573 RepID=A0A9X3MZW9_9ACTN|nr:ABC transporter permease [Solirubrobacter ginsenosidimutans]MDA0164756.1 ABC transporter permease [Solirubrobacter ginsenosidimutans]
MTNLSAETPSGAPGSAAQREAERLAAPADPSIRRLQPGGRRVAISDIWTSFPIASRIATRDVRIRFKQSAIGPLWLLVQPIGILFGFVLVFNGVTHVDTDGIPYAPFAVVGIAVWSCANLALAAGVRTHVVNWRFVRLVACPRIAFVTAAILSSIPNLLITLALAVVVIVASGLFFPLQVLLLPLPIAWLLLLLWSMTNLLSALNVRRHDVGELVPVILQGGIFVTPVGYAIGNVSPNLKLLLSLNPFTGIIEAFRWCMLGAPVTELALGLALATTVLLTIVGWWVFVRLEPSFADVV